MWATRVKGTKIDSSIKNWNSPPPGPGDIQSRRPFNTFARIRYPDFEGASSYNALQVHLEHRLAHALSFTAADTYSYDWTTRPTTPTTAAAAARTHETLTNGPTVSPTSGTTWPSATYGRSRLVQRQVIG